MPAPPGTPERQRASRHEIPADGEQFVRERAQQLQNENAALRRELEALRESRERYRSLVEQSPDAVFVHDLEGQLLYANPTALRLTGVQDIRELEGRSAFAALPAEGVGVARAGIQALMRGESLPPIAMPVQLPDGSRIFVEAMAAMIEYGGRAAVQVVLRDVTERKKAEEDLRESEARLRLATESAGMFGWEIDLAAQTFAWSENAERVIDTPLPTKVADIWTLVHPDDRAALQEVLERMIESGGEFRVEYRILTPPSDREIWLLSAGVAIAGANGRPARLVGLSQNITERKQAEEVLQEREEQLRNLIESSGDGIVLTDETGRITTWNRGMEAITTLAASDILGRPAWEIQAEIVDADWAGPDYRKRYRAVWDRVLKEGAYPHYNRLLDVQIRTPNGEVRYLQQSLFTIPTRRGYRVGCIMRDVTERRREEREKEMLLQRIEAERSILRSVLEQMPEAVMIAEAPSGRIILDNKQLLQICRLPVDLDIDVAKAPSWSAYGYHPDGRPYGIEEWPLFRALHRGEVIVDEEIRVRRGDETLGCISVRAAPIRDAGGAIQGAVVLAADITRRKRAEELLEERSRDLQRSNEDLERFAYAVFHDLLEPVRMITSYAQLLARRYRGKLDADADEFVGFIEQGGRRMHDLITDLLAYSRVSTRQQPLVPTDTETVLAEVQQNLQFTLQEAGAEVTHDPLPAVLADPTQLRQVFQNLIANAVKFRREGVPPRVHVAAERDGGMVRFSVADNGIGIDPQYFDQIFVVFRRLHAQMEYEGTGIGLAIVKRIVERHGGRIWVESEPGRGSTFFFTLPAVQEAGPGDREPG